jgi:hypothetical protein
VTLRLALTWSNRLDSRESLRGGSLGSQGGRHAPCYSTDVWEPSAARAVYGRRAREPQLGRVQCHSGCRAAVPFGRRSINEPIAAPGQVVQLQLNPSCPGENGTFDSTNVVQLILRGVASVTPLSSVLAAQHMTATIPDTSDPVKRPNGLAGRASIVVTTAKGTPVATISQLYQPTSGCDHQPDQGFKQFTVLPRPNDISTAQTLLATLDGNDTLLIPFDHSKVSPVSATEVLGVFERGKGFFRNFKTGGKQAWEAIVAAITAGTSPSDLVELTAYRPSGAQARACRRPRAPIKMRAVAKESPRQAAAY